MYPQSSYPRMDNIPQAKLQDIYFTVAQSKPPVSSRSKSSLEFTFLYIHFMCKLDFRMVLLILQSKEIVR